MKKFTSNILITILSFGLFTSVMPVRAIAATGTPIGTCGTVVTQGLPSGRQTSPTTYDYELNSDGSVAGNTVDHRWVHLYGTAAGVWDMGKRQSQVWLVPSIDHTPVPEEANETLIYYGDSASGPWTLANRVSEDMMGPTDWISDNYMGLWEFDGAHRYVRAMSTENDTIASENMGLFISHDTEIDAICAISTPATNQGDECKKGGWMNFHHPLFKNQGQCVSWFNHQ